MAGSVSSLLLSTSHVHLGNEVCPWCEQAIPHDKFEEISARIAEEEQARLEEQATRLRDQFAQERLQLTQASQSEIEAAKRLASQAVADAASKAEAQLASVMAEADERLAAAVARSKQDADAAWTEKVVIAEEAARVAAEEKAASETAMRNMEETYASRAAETERQHRLAVAAAVSETERSTAERLQAAMEEASGKVAVAEAARVEAERLSQERVAGAERERAALAQQLAESSAAHAEELATRINEVRESLGKEMSKAVLDTQAAAFAEKQRLTAAVDDLKRQLEKKTAAELGEGSEIDLFEALREAFDGDVIRRVPKGENGADVVHEIVENGVVCGTIVYDSKNRNAWQGNFASKLYTDMIAAKADHAILSTNKFPAGTRQLHLMNGVIIACPARVVALVQLLRAHIAQTHGLRVSAEEREEKTAALYDYVTSERCSQLMDSMQTAFEKLEAIDVDEKKAHDVVWTKRGRVLKEVEKTRGTLVFELQKIIGTAEAAE